MTSKKRGDCVKGDKSLKIQKPSHPGSIIMQRFKASP